MSYYHSSAAVKIPAKSDFPPNMGHIYRVLQETEEDAVSVTLNERLARQCGENFSIRCFAGDQLSAIPEATLISLAECYAQVFNESWGESWTLESALKEIKSCIYCDEDYMPVMTLLLKAEKVVGFSWGFIMDSQCLSGNSGPFSSSALKRHESVKVAKYWLDVIGKKNKLLSIRELGVIKEYRQDKTPFLTLPLFEKAKSLNCNVAFLRTKITSKAFKWCLGVGFVPLQLFMVDDLLLMQGSISYAMKVLYGLTEEARKRKCQVEVISNIKRYLCQ